VIIG